MVEWPARGTRPWDDELREYIDPSVSSPITITSSTHTFGSLSTYNEWNIATPTTITLPSTGVVPGSSFTVKVDRMDRISWASGIEEVGMSDDLFEAWLTLLRTSSGWKVLVGNYEPDNVRTPDYWEWTPENLDWDNGTVRVRVGDTKYTDPVIGMTNAPGMRISFPFISDMIFGAGYIANTAGGVLSGEFRLSGPPYSNGSFVNLPAEGALEDPHTLATREWVRGGVPISVPDIEALAPFVADSSVPVGASTFVEAIGKPVWKKDSETFVDALGAVVYPEED